MSSQLVQLPDATIKQHCKTLRMPTIASQFGTLAEQAFREEQTHTGYIKALLNAETEERERNTIDRPKQTKADLSGPINRPKRVQTVRTVKY